MGLCFFFFFSSRRRHTRFDCDWSSDVCSSDLFPNSNLVAAICLIGTAAGVASLLFAADQKQARVTEVIHDVRLLAGQTAARPATVNDTVHEGTAVRTGTDSRAELTVLDQTLTRLGANTGFSFGAAARTYDLGSGAILISAPK